MIIVVFFLLVFDNKIEREGARLSTTVFKVYGMQTDGQNFKIAPSEQHLYSSNFDNVSIRYICVFLAFSNDKLFCRYLFSKPVKYFKNAINERNLPDERGN